MFLLRSARLACAAAILFNCVACSSEPPAQSADGAASSVSPAVSLPDTSIVPDETSVPALFIPDAAPEQPASSDAVPAEEPAPAPAKSEPDAAPAAAPVEEPPAPQPIQPEPEPEPAPTKPTPPDASASQYDFSQPVPERSAVELDYFSDAAFVGDSRSEGFYLYGVKRGKNLSSSGLSVFTFTQKKSFVVNGVSRSALGALDAGDYSKIYLGFGVNELGYVNTEKFYQNYCRTIDSVRACQPYAVVYIQTMAPVNEAQVAATGGAKHLNNDRVRLYNDLIRKAAQEKSVPLLDVYSLFAVDGSLPSDASRDGIHLNREYCQKQLEYFRSHTVDFDTLYPQPEPEVLPDETSDLPAADSSAAPDPDSLLPQSEQEPVPAEPAPAAAGDGSLL